MATLNHPLYLAPFNSSLLLPDSTPLTIRDRILRHGSHYQQLKHHIELLRHVDNDVIRQREKVEQLEQQVEKNTKELRELEKESMNAYQLYASTAHRSLSLPSLKARFSGNRTERAKSVSESYATVFRQQQAKEGQVRMHQESLAQEKQLLETLKGSQTHRKNLVQSLNALSLVIFGPARQRHLSQAAQSPDPAEDDPDRDLLDTESLIQSEILSLEEEIRATQRRLHSYTIAHPLLQQATLSVLSAYKMLVGSKNVYDLGPWEKVTDGIRMSNEALQRSKQTYLKGYRIYRRVSNDMPDLPRNDASLLSEDAGENVEFTYTSTPQRLLYAATLLSDRYKWTLGQIPKLNLKIVSLESMLARARNDLSEERSRIVEEVLGITQEDAVLQGEPPQDYFSRAEWVLEVDGTSVHPLDIPSSPTSPFLRDEHGVIHELPTYEVPPSFEHVVR